MTATTYTVTDTLTGRKIARAMHGANNALAIIGANGERMRIADVSGDVRDVIKGAIFGKDSARRFARVTAD